MGGGVDGLKGYNVQTIAMQVPKSKLAKSGAAPTGATDPNAVIGVWSTTSRQATTSSRPTARPHRQRRLGADQPPWRSPGERSGSAPGEPRTSGTTPSPADDAQFLAGVTDPELAKLFKAIYNIQVPPAPRDDLVAIFLTGIPGLTEPPTSTLKPSEELRLNMGVPPFANPNSLGVVGGDNAGFPNGRRLADDVTDIELKAVAGAAYPLFHPDFKADALAAQLGDGVDANDVPFRTSFPYVALAHDGTSSVPHGTTAGQAQAPSAPPAAQPPIAQVPPTTMQPGMPKTGGFMQIDHLGDIYGIAIALAATLGGLVLLSGWAVRRRAAEGRMKKYER